MQVRGHGFWIRDSAEGTIGIGEFRLRVKQREPTFGVVALAGRDGLGGLKRRAPSRVFDFSGEARLFFAVSFLNYLNRPALCASLAFQKKSHLRLYQLGWLLSYR